MYILFLLHSKRKTNNTKIPVFLGFYSLKRKQFQYDLRYPKDRFIQVLIMFHDYTTKAKLLTVKLYLVLFKVL